MNILIIPVPTLLHNY